jgi:hypothetical protein
MSGLYDQDFHAWALAQAAALRRAAELRINLPDVDIEYLAEEIEDMGKEQAHAVESALARIIEHLLKLQYSPAVDPRRGWVESVMTHRDMLESRLEMNPSLASPRRVEAALAKAWVSGRRMAEASLRNYDEAAAAASIPQDCPYSFEQLCDFDWLPADPHSPAGA